MIKSRKLRVVIPGLGVFALLLMGALTPLSAQDRASGKSSVSGEAPSRAASAPAAKASRASSGRSASSTRSTAPRSSGGSSNPPVVDTRRSSGRHGSGGSYRGHHNRRGHWGLSLGFGNYYPYRYYPAYYGYYDFYPYYHWGVPYYRADYGYGHGSYRSEQALGALDLNVKPKKAEVYLNGQYIGKVREFDGWPGHLWLEKGTYELIFFYPGLGTQRREFTVYPGIVVDVDLRLVAGESVAPDQITRAVPPEAGAMAEVRAAYRAQQGGGATAAPNAQVGERTTLDTRAAPGRLHLDVVPADASVYLDGRLVGSGQELTQLEDGLIVDAGSHRLEIVRPGYEAQRREFDLEPGDELKLSVALLGAS